MLLVGRVQQGLVRRVAAGTQCEFFPAMEEELKQRRRRLDRREAPSAVSKKESLSVNSLMRAFIGSCRASEKASLP